MERRLPVVDPAVGKVRLYLRVGDWKRRREQRNGNRKTLPLLRRFWRENTLVPTQVIHRVEKKTQAMVYAQEVGLSLCFLRVPNVITGN